MKVLQPLFTFYKLALSPIMHLLLGPQYGCRFVPTCSQYSEEALARWGIWRGAWMSLRRVLRCNPFSRAGYDPVPHVIGEAHINHSAALNKKVVFHGP